MNKKIFFCLLLLLSVWLPLAFAGGDEIEMKDGTSLRGDILMQNETQVYLQTSEGLKQVEFSKIKTIHFGPAVRTETLKPLLGQRKSSG